MIKDTRQILKKKENMKKNKYDKNPEPKKENCKKLHKKKKKCLNKFFQQIRQSPHFICTVCHQRLYKRSCRLFENENNIFLLPNCIVQ